MHNGGLRGGKHPPHATKAPGSVKSNNWRKGSEKEEVNSPFILKSEKSWQKLDISKIVAESWQIENSNINLELTIAPDFNTPKRQLEQLEKTSNELNNINNRVTQTLLQYETINNQDDVFQLLEEDDEVQFTAGFDRKSIMEESKGKVKVLIIDYNKLGMKRENVLSSLKDWFDEMKNDNFSEYESDEASQKWGDDIINILSSAHMAKDKLLDIHTELVEYFQNVMKTASAKNKGPDPETQQSIEKLQKQYDEALNNLREAEGRAFSYEKMLERKEEELRFYRVNDNTKTSALKEELFAYQQQAQEREAELAKDLKRTKLQLEKAQQQLDMWVVEMQTKELRPSDSTIQLDFKNMDPDEFKDLFNKSEMAKRKLQGQIRLLNEHLSGQELLQEKELNLVKVQKEEEFNNRIIKIRQEQRETMEKLKEEHNAQLEELKQDYQAKLDLQIKNVETIVAEKDSKKAVDVLKRTYDEKMKLYRESSNDEVVRLKQQMQSKETDLKTEWELKLQLVIDSQAAEKEKTIQEVSQRFRKEIAELKHQLEAAVLSEQITAQTNINALKKSLAAEMKDLLSQVNSREATVKELQHRVETLNDMISAEYAKLEKEMNEVQEQQDKFKRQSSNRSLDDIKIQIAQEKKKAVDLAMHKMKLEKEAAISALMAKFEHEKEAALEQERKKLAEEKKNSVEQTRQELLLEKETNVQYLQDELAAAKQQLDKERSTRDRSGSVNSEEVKAIKAKYEKTIADLEEELNKMGADTVVQLKETIRVLELKLTQVRAENEYLRAFEERLMGHGSQLPPPVTMSTIAEAVQTEESSFVGTLSRVISKPMIATTTESTETDEPVFELQASESVKSAKKSTPQEEQEQVEIVQTPVSVDEEEITRQLQPSESKVVEYELPPKALTPEEAIRLLEMDTRIEQIKRILQKENVDSVSTLLEAQRQQNRAVKELIELNEERKKEIETARETLERRVAILLIENERLRKGLAVDESVADKALSAEKIEANTKAVLLENTMREKVELEQKVTYYEDQLESTKKLLEAVESSRYELQHLVKTLQTKLSTLESSKPTQEVSEEQLKKLQEKMEQERGLLIAQIKDVELKLQHEMQAAKASSEQSKTSYEESLQALANEQQETVANLTEGYETRIRGLTEALTACLNDAALVDELKKETDENIRTAKLLNELEMARVKENMKKLEQDHRNSLAYLQNVDKTELQRMHKTVERLKHEFAVLLEEEKVSMQENEYNRSNLEILDKIRHDLEDYMHDTNDKNEIKFMVDRDIKTVSALYDAMLSVLKNRRESLATTIKDKNQLVDTLQEQMLAKTNALLETKDKLVDQEKILQKVQSEKALANFNDGKQLAELQAALKNSEETVKAYKQAHKENETTIVDLMHRINNSSILLDEDKRRMREQDKTVSELRAQVENYKKQLIAHEMALAALKLQAEQKIQQIAATTVASIPHVMQRPLTDRPAPSTASPAIHRTSGVATPHHQQPYHNRPSTVNRLVPGPFQPDLSIANALTSIPLRIDAISASRSTKAVEKIWTDMIRNNALDEEERQRRTFAAELLRRDKRLRQQRVSIAFAKLHERHKHKLLKQQVAELEEPNDHLSKVLKRMEERHKNSLAKWEDRKKALVELRSKEWELLVRAVTDVANYRTYTSIPLSVNPLPIGGTTSITVASYPDFPGVYSGGGKRQIEYTVEVRKPEDRHMLNFKQLYPFSENLNSNPAKPNFRMMSSRNHLKPLLDGAPKFDMILEWPGIEGKKIATARQTESQQQQNRPSSAPNMKTEKAADAVLDEVSSPKEPSSVRLPPLSGPHTPKSRTSSVGSLKGPSLPPISPSRDVKPPEVAEEPKPEEESSVESESEKQQEIETQEEKNEEPSEETTL